jgi:hypothetical protein
MKLFCFASRSLENVQRGYDAGRWAVATTSDKDQQTRRTKIRKNVRVGDLGLLYCNPLASFMVPFQFESEPEMTGVDAETWREPWIFPFRIYPLCGTERLVSATEAEEGWGIARRRFAEMGSRVGGISAALLLTGTAVFSPLHISYRGWAEILRDFGVASPKAA